MEAYANNLPKANPSNLAMYDQMFLTILQKEAKIELFLDAVFNFLYSKTDFFRFLTKENPKLGFRPGDANRLVEGYFTRYMKMSIEAYTEAAEAKKVKAKEKAKETAENEPKIQEIPQEEPKKTESTPKPTPNPTPKAINADPILDTKNGGQTDLYSWTQTHDEIEVNIKTPEYVEKASQIKVDIKQSPTPWMKVQFLGGSSSDPKDPYINSEIHGPISKEESTWSFDKKSKILNITLTKNSTLWWDRVCPDDKPIDMAKVECVRPMEDMSVEELSVINKLRYDQHQKRLGKATSEQERTLEALRKGWNAEGSPFKGTEFDPSKVNLDSVK